MRVGWLKIYSFTPRSGTVIDAFSGHELNQSSRSAGMFQATIWTNGARRQTVQTVIREELETRWQKM